MKKFLKKILAFIIFIVGTFVVIPVAMLGGDFEGVLDLWHGAAIELWENK